MRLLHLPAGPPRRLAKSLIDAHIDEFSAGLAALDVRYDLLHSHHWMSGAAALGRWPARGESRTSRASTGGRAAGVGAVGRGTARVAGAVPGERLVATESDAVIAISAAEAGTVVER